MAQAQLCQSLAGVEGTNGRFGSYIQEGTQHVVADSAACLW